MMKVEEVKYYKANQLSSLAGMDQQTQDLKKVINAAID